MSDGLGPVIAFGEFRLDAQRRHLQAITTGETVPLNPRAFEALLYLAGRAGELVSKSELMRAIWPGISVEQNSLSQCISSLRRALGEEPNDHRYIVTEAGRGYRFVAGMKADSRIAGEALSGRSTNNPHAYQLYVSGWSALTRPGGGNLERGLRGLERAVLLDPNFALAHVCIADAYAMLGVLGLAAPRDVFPKARAAVLNALAISDGLAEAHAEFGHILTVFDLDWLTAEAAYRRALAINPRCAMAHHYLGLQMICNGRLEAALEHVRRAQALEPLAANINANIGMIHYYAGRYHEAIAQLEATLDLDPSFAHARALLGRCFLRLGEFDRALKEFEQRADATIGTAADIPATLALSGRKAEAKAQLQRLLERGLETYVSPFDIAIIQAALGDAEAALRWLATALDQRAQPVNFAMVDPAFRQLREDSRFVQMFRKQGIIKSSFGNA